MRTSTMAYMAALALTASLALACDRESGDAGTQLEDPRAEADGPLPQLGLVPEFQFINQDGKSFGSKELAHKPYLVAFMFTRCPSICPDLTRKMKAIDDEVKKSGHELRVLSISVDPENDRPDVLKAYAKKFGANVPNWNFLTGDYQTILKTAEEGFKVGLSGKVDESKPHLGITHGSHLVLVDGDGQIRGYFRSSDASIAQEIVAALGKLSA